MLYLEEKDKEHWKEVAEKDIALCGEGHIDLSYMIGERIEYCSDRWCPERLYHVELLMAELKKRLEYNTD